MKVLRSIKMLTALILTLTFIVMVPLQTVAAAENKGKYVSEVYVAYGKNADAAKKTLEDKGFTPQRYPRLHHRPRGNEYERRLQR